MDLFHFGGKRRQLGKLRTQAHVISFLYVTCEFSGVMERNGSGHVMSFGNCAEPTSEMFKSDDRLKPRRKACQPNVRVALNRELQPVWSRAF
ncbi:hypothetical protein HJO_06145 [Hyphomonas johnsonii MHS-2]|uniref:Uncharacterized protein n=1 Tax=Hyphomonas johnsonii MHS-2 TaxID=1280950 RepID=A0A059FRX6_9PROT|nr:hypothetical protein HJO_06145 [Hyphomonas johnsonii MHS-2]